MGQAQVDREHIYNTLRREIVDGTIASDQLVTSVEVEDRFSTAAKVAPQIISALAVDGYLRKTKGGYVPEHWSYDEVEEILTQLQMLHEICALHWRGHEGRKAAELEASRLGYEAGGTSDARFLAILEWLRAGMALANSTIVVDLAVLVARPAIFRIIWAMIESAPELRHAMVEVEIALTASDYLAPRDAVTRFWSIVLARHAGSADRTLEPCGLGGEFEIIEPTLAGKIPAFGRSEYRSEALLPRFKDSHASAQPLPV